MFYYIIYWRTWSTFIAIYTTFYLAFCLVCFNDIIRFLNNLRKMVCLIEHSLGLLFGIQTLITHKKRNKTLIPSYAQANCSSRCPANSAVICPDNQFAASYTVYAFWHFITNFYANCWLLGKFFFSICIMHIIHMLGFLLCEPWYVVSYKQAAAAILISNDSYKQWVFNKAPL